jgi:hypothetical protein
MPLKGSLTQSTKSKSAELSNRKRKTNLRKRWKPKISKTFLSRKGDKKSYLLEDNLVRLDYWNDIR